MTRKASVAKAEELAAAASHAANQTDAGAKDGRSLGLLSIAVAPGAVLISPTAFSLLGFFFALMGLTVAAPRQRKLSIAGIVLAGVCGGIGYFLNTPIV